MLPKSNVPSFTDRPAENNEFLPCVSECVRGEGATPLRVDGVFDVLVTGTRDSTDKYLELKVRLGSANVKGARFSARQWHFFSDFPTSLSPRFRVFVYDHAQIEYSILTAEALKNGLQKHAQSDTCYVSQRFLSGVEWHEPETAFSMLLAWLHGEKLSVALELKAQAAASSSRVASGGARIKSAGSGKIVVPLRGARGTR